MSSQEKYRIKQETYKDGSVRYYPQYYKGFFYGWRSLHKDGEKCLYASDLHSSSREGALKSIDLCEKGKNTIIHITYEYIN